MSALSSEIVLDIIQQINDIQIGNKANDQLVNEIYSIIDQKISVETQVASPSASHYFFYSGGDTGGINGNNVSSAEIAKSIADQGFDAATSNRSIAIIDNTPAGRGLPTPADRSSQCNHT